MDIDAVEAAFAPLYKNIEQVAAAFSEAATAISKRMAEIMQAMQPALQQMYDAIYAEYVARGAIYGATHEGMTRWLEEQSEIARNQALVQYERDREWDVADLRRTMAERRT